MNIRKRNETYGGWGCEGYKTRAEAESIKQDVEINIRRMPGLTKLNVQVQQDSASGRFFVYDQSEYDDDERIRLTNGPHYPR